MPFPRLRAGFWIAAISVLATSAGRTHAAGLGPIDVQSALGQSFRANIAVLGSDARNQGPGCVKARLESLDGILSIVPVVSMVRDEQSTSIRLSSRESINEPALNIQVTLGCDVSVQRLYQVLLDPVMSLPTIGRQAASPVSPVPAARSQSINAPVDAEPAAASTAGRGRGNRPPALPRAPTLDDAAPVTAAAPAKLPPKPAIKPKPAGRSVLRMGPVDDLLDDANINLRLKFSNTLTLPAKGTVNGSTPNATPAMPGTASSGTANPAASPAAANDASVAANAVPSDPAAMSARTEELLKASQALVAKSLQAEAEMLRQENAKIKQQASGEKRALDGMRDELLTWIKSLGLILLLCLLAIAWLIWRFQAIRKSQYQESWKELFPEQDNTATTETNSIFGNTTFNTTELVTAQLSNTEQLQPLSDNERKQSAEVAGLTHEAARTSAPAPLILPPSVTTAAVTQLAPSTMLNPAPRNKPAAKRSTIAGSSRAPATNAASLYDEVKEAEIAPVVLSKTDKVVHETPEPAQILAPFEYSHSGSAPYLFSNQVEYARPEPATARAGTATAANAGKAEEISDVMELVEAWMALHQPEKVLELLEPFSKIDRPESPLPWLCLLDVYRSLNDQDKYEAILHRITTLFNVKLASWEDRSISRHYRTLGNFPHVVERILELWGGDDIGAYLESLLLDNRDGARDGFDLPVYRDLARLKALAQDPARPRDLEQLRQIKAYAPLFAEPAPAVDDAAQAPIAYEAVPPATDVVKPLLRERPKYITTSYQSAVGSKDAKLDGKAKTSADVSAAADIPAAHAGAASDKAAGPSTATAVKARRVQPAEPDVLQLDEPEIKKASFFLPRSETASKTRRSLSAKPAPAEQPAAIDAAVANEAVLALPIDSFQLVPQESEPLPSGPPEAKSLPPLEMLHIPGTTPKLPAGLIAAGNEEISPMIIKLHLAIAYQDIGDIEGACMLLDEVIRDGTPEQSKQAKLLLSALG